MANNYIGQDVIGNKTGRYFFLIAHKAHFYKGLSGYGQFYDRNDQLGLTNKIAIVRKDSLKIFIKFLKEDILLLGIKDSLAISGKEYLAVDFGWQPGDTVFSEYYKPGNYKYLIIDKQLKGVKDRITNTDTIHYLKFKGKAEPNFFASDFADSNVIINGMGFTASFFLRFMNFDTSFHIISHSSGRMGISGFCSDGELFYCNLNMFGGSPGCDSIDTRYLISVEENAGKETIHVYPNPVNDILAITGIANEGEINFQVTNILGEEIEAGYGLNGEALTADVSHLPAGVYFIRLSTDKSSYLRRIIKQ